MKKVYFAGPLFSLAEKEFNLRLSNEIKLKRSDIDIILPQERSPKFLHLKNGLELIFKDCLAMVAEVDFIVAILDGADADSGTSVELGYAHAKGKQIIGVRTDFRISEDRGLNLMLSNICSTLILDTKADILELAEAIADAIG